MSAVANEVRIENCFVLYFDILGFSNDLKEDERNEILKKILKVLEEFKISIGKSSTLNITAHIYGKYREDDIKEVEKRINNIEIARRAFSISDSFFVVVNSLDVKEAFRDIQIIASHITYFILSENRLIRGAIGYCDNLVIIGNSLLSNLIPKLVNEEKVNPYPRITLHRSVLKFFNNDDHENFKIFEVSKGEYEKNFFELSDDGFYFLNWLKYFSISSDRIFLSRQGDCVNLDCCVKACENKLLDSWVKKDMKIFTKWFWMKSFIKREVDILENLNNKP